MVFSSTTFLLAFLPLVGILYFICPRKLRNALLLVFSLLYTPCIAAVTSVRRELGGNGRSGWPYGSVSSRGWWLSWPTVSGVCCYERLGHSHSRSGDGSAVSCVPHRRRKPEKLLRRLQGMQQPRETRPVLLILPVGLQGGDTMKKPHKPIPSPRDLKGTIRRQPVVFAVYLVLRLIVLGTLVSSIIRGEYESAFICLLVLALFMLPFFIQQNFGIELPSTLEIIILLFIFAAEILGDITSFNNLLQPGRYDVMMNFNTIFLTVLIHPFKPRIHSIV